VGAKNSKGIEARERMRRYGWAIRGREMLFLRKIS
jgi:hypothetical protein